MTVKRINFTGRQRISRAHVRIRIRKVGNSSAFEATLDLEDYNFPSDSRIAIEAYRSIEILRFDFGTLASPGPLPPGPMILDELGDPNNVLFQVKVTSASSRPGMILGEAEKIRPTDSDERQDSRVALLPVVPEKLGDELWQVVFSDQEVILAINEAVGDYKAIAASPEFRSLVYPAVLRQILEHILIAERYSEIEDEERWESSWLTFGRGLCGQGPPEMTTDGDESENQDATRWVHAVVAEFCRRHGMLRMFSSDRDGEEGT